MLTLAPPPPIPPLPPPLSPIPPPQQPNPDPADSAGWISKGGEFDFDILPGQQPSVHRILWAGSRGAGNITMESYWGGGGAARFTARAGNNFVPGSEQFNFNYWISGGDVSGTVQQNRATFAPASGSNSSVVISCFKFCPIAAGGCSPKGVRPSCP